MKQRILVIEDNEQNVYLVTYLLEHAGFEVIQARDGPSGLQMAMRSAPDLILLDVQLPGMDGFEVTRRLRATPSLATVPIVAVTSYAMVGDRERIMAAGCSAYLEKPIDPDTFVANLARWLTREGEHVEGHPDRG